MIITENSLLVRWRHKAIIGFQLIAMGQSLLAASDPASRAWTSPSTNSYSIEGKLKYKVYAGADGMLGSGDNVKAQMERMFKVTVMGCKWVIRTVPIAEDATKRAADSYEATFDGDNIYRVTTLNPSYDMRNIPEPLKKDWKATHKSFGQAKAPWNKAIATIDHGPVPVFGADFVTAVWIAYASSCYLSQNTNNDLVNIWSPDKSTKPAKWNIGEHSLGLPERIIYYTDSTLLATNCLYETFDVTNISEFTFPLQFRITRYAISGSKTLTSVEGEVMSIKLGVAFSNAPPSTEVPTAVEDHRLDSSAIQACTV